MPYDRKAPNIWLATKNASKYREAKLTLSRYGILLRQLKTSKIEIQSGKLAEIAEYAAEHLPRRPERQLTAIEDSGLFVNALNGFPGPYSSHFERTVGIEGILALLGKQKDRQAYYHCAIALIVPRAKTVIFEGRVTGKISFRARGKEGFGYDPIFIPDGYDKTFGETGNEIKKQISHRSRAFKKMAMWYLDRWPRSVSGALK